MSSAERVLILGANSDIGRALAHQYAKEGYSLYLAARNATERLSPDVSDLQLRYQATAIPLEFDALHYDTHPNFYAQMAPSPAIVICVFGYLGEQIRAEKNPAEFRQILETNYVGAASILNEVAEQMATQGKGLIIGISSVAGDRGRGDNYFYGSAKAGFTAYLSGLRNRLASKGVHVMTVKPGYMRTRMTEGMDLPGPLTALPEEVAKRIFKAGQKRKNVVYVRWMWRYIMLIIRFIPEGVFKKLKWGREDN